MLQFSKYKLLQVGEQQGPLRPVTYLFLLAIGVVA